MPLPVNTMIIGFVFNLRAYVVFFLALQVEAFLRGPRGFPGLLKWTLTSHIHSIGNASRRTGQHHGEYHEIRSQGALAIGGRFHTYAYVAVATLWWHHCQCH